MAVVVVDAVVYLLQTLADHGLKLFDLAFHQEIVLLQLVQLGISTLFAFFTFLMTVTTISFIPMAALASSSMTAMFHFLVQMFLGCFVCPHLISKTDELLP